MASFAGNALRWPDTRSVARAERGMVRIARLDPLDQIDERRIAMQRTQRLHQRRPLGLTGTIVDAEAREMRHDALRLAEKDEQRRYDVNREHVAALLIVAALRTECGETSGDGVPIAVPFERIEDIADQRHRARVGHARVALVQRARGGIVA